MRFQMGFLGRSAGFAQKGAPVTQTGLRSINPIAKGGEAGDIALVIGAAYHDSAETLIAANPSGWTQLRAGDNPATDDTSGSPPFVTPANQMALLVAAKKLNGAEGSTSFFSVLGDEFIFHLFLYENSQRNLSSGSVVFPALEGGIHDWALWPLNPGASTITAGSSAAPTVAGCGYAWTGGSAPDQTFTVSGGEDESVLTTSGTLRLRSKTKLFAANPANVAVDLENGVTRCVYTGFWIQG